MDKQSPYESLLTFLRLRESSENTLDGTPGIDWEGIVEQSFNHGVSALLFERLKKLGESLQVPSEIAQKLKSSQLRTGFTNTKLYHELGSVLRALSEETIPVIVLKGAHLAELVYGNVALRSMDDIDLLVKERDLSRVEKKLFDLGYVHLTDDAERMRSASPHHLTPFRKDGCTPIEVHWTLPSMGAAGTSDSEVWDRAQQVDIAGRRALILSPEDLLIHISIHASLHHRFGIGLRPLCDIAAITTRYHDVLDWDKVRTSAQRWGLQSGVYLTLLVAKEMVGADVPESALQAMKPNHFDAALVDWAKEQINTQSNELTHTSSISPRLAQLWGAGSLTGKMKQLFRAAFSTRQEMARMYNVSADSPRLYFYYPKRWKDLILLRGGVLWRLLRGDRDAIAKAEMYQKLIDTPQQM